MNEKNVTSMMFMSVCQEIEEIAAQMYYFFADHFAGNEKIALLMRKTAQEEDNHALQVVLAKKLFGTIAGCRLDFNQAELNRSQLVTTFEEFKKTPPFLEEALRTSIMLEKSLSQFHMSNAMIFEDKGGEAFFEALLMDDRKHVETLEIALTEALLVGRLRAA